MKPYQTDNNDLYRLPIGRMDIQRTNHQTLTIKATIGVIITLPKNKLVDDFFYLLDSRRGMAVSVPQDAIYGHIGLAPAYFAGKFLIDYNIPTHVLFETVARLYVETCDSLEVLKFVEVSDLDARTHEMPSWCPNVSIRVTTYSSQILGSR